MSRRMWLLFFCDFSNTLYRILKSSLVPTSYFMGSTFFNSVFYLLLSYF